MRNYSKVWGSLNYVTMCLHLNIFQLFFTPFVLKFRLHQLFSPYPGNDHHPSVTIKAHVEMSTWLCQVHFFFWTVFVFRSKWPEVGSRVGAASQNASIFSWPKEPRVVTLMSRVRGKFNGLSVVKLMGFPVRSGGRRHTHTCTHTQPYKQGL